MAILFYDLETFGLSPARDRIAEFAALRTDSSLEMMEQPTEIRCVPPPDYLASPAACIKTGITPQEAAQTGLTEPLFARRLRDLFLRDPSTIIVGYNSASFDDEFVRHLMYRSLVEPYAWHSSGGNARFDLLTLMGALYDFHREHLVWPRDAADRPDFRLEALAEANGAVAGTAHEALADTFALRNICSLIIERTPEVWSRARELTGARRVETVLTRAVAELDRGDPQLLIYSSPLLKRPERASTLVLPIGGTRTPAPSFWVWDLTRDPTPLVTQDPVEAAQGVFVRGRTDVLAGLTLINPRRFPVLFRPERSHVETLESRGVRWETAVAHASRWTTSDLRTWRDRFLAERTSLDAHHHARTRDVEERLYEGFAPEPDRGVLRRLSDAQTRGLTERSIGAEFTDERLAELAWRLRARFAGTTLTTSERDAWHRECVRRLDVEAFDTAWNEEAAIAAERRAPQQRLARVLAQLAEHRQTVVERFSIDAPPLVYSDSGATPSS